MIRYLFFVLVAVFFNIESSAKDWPSPDFHSFDETKQYELLSLSLRDHELTCDTERGDRLMALASNRSHRIRNAIVLLLDSCRASTRTQEIGEFLHAMIENDTERSEVRSSAISVLGGMGEITPQVRSTLKNYAINAKGAVRRENAMLSWSAFGVADDELLDLIYQRFTAQRKSTRVVAVRCLQLLADNLKSKPQKLDDVITVIADNLPSGHIYFDLALVRLAEALQPASKKLMPILINTLEQAPFVRKELASILPQFGAAAKPALPMLRKLADNATGFEGKTINEAILQIESF